MKRFKVLSDTSVNSLNVQIASLEERYKVLSVSAPSAFFHDHGRHFSVTICYETTFSSDTGRTEKYM